MNFNLSDTRLAAIGPNPALALLSDSQLDADPFRLLDSVGTLDYDTSSFSVRVPKPSDWLPSLFSRTKTVDSTVPPQIPQPASTEWRVTRFLDRHVVQPIKPAVNGAGHFLTIGAQEGFSFGVLTPIFSTLIGAAILAINPEITMEEPQNFLESFFKNMMGAFLVSAPVTTGIFGGFPTKWGLSKFFDPEKIYFKTNPDGTLVLDNNGKPIQDVEAWGFTAPAFKIFREAQDSILTLANTAHAYWIRGLVGGPKFLSKAFPTPIEAFKNSSLGFLPKTRGEAAGLLPELMIDVGLYFLFGYLNGDMNESLLLVTSLISVLAYTDTAVTICNKYEATEAVIWRQIFSIIKNPAVIIVSSGLFSALAHSTVAPEYAELATWALAIGTTTIVSGTLWAWAKHGMEGTKQVPQHHEMVELLA